jgi:hypothetical protein
MRPGRPVAGRGPTVGSCNSCDSRAALWILIAVGLLACAPDTRPVPLAEPDVASFGELQPWLEARCATLDCHGDPGRPLRLFSETGLRAPGTSRDAPLSSAELEDNAWSLFGVDDAPAERHLAVTKPLARSAGGVDHVGGDVWTSRDDPMHRCLVGWLDEARRPESWTVDCAAARAAWSVLPESP